MDLGGSIELLNEISNLCDFCLNLQQVSLRKTYSNLSAKMKRDCMALFRKLTVAKNDLVSILI